jgi:hypothetical protein
MQDMRNRYPVIGEGLPGAVRRNMCPPRVPTPNEVPITGYRPTPTM